MTESKHYQRALDAVANMTEADIEEAERYAQSSPFTRLPWRVEHNDKSGMSCINLPVGDGYHHAVTVQGVGGLSHAEIADAIVRAINERDEYQDVLKDVLILIRECEELEKEPLDWSILYDFGLACNRIEKLLGCVGSEQIN